MRPITVICLCGAMSAGAGLSGQSERLAAEISRLAVDAPNVLPDESRQAIMSRLDRSRKALDAQQIYLALYDIQPAFEAEGGYRLASESSAVPDQAAFKRRWTGMGPPADPPSRKAPVLFVEALAQSAEGRAPATYRASLPYAQDGGLVAGLYYLGEAHAMVRFAALCRELPVPPAGRSLMLGSIEPALAAYEATVVKAFDAAPAPQRPQYAGVNVAIKLSRTLNEQRRYEGALLQYLISRYRYQVIANADRSVSSADEVRAKLGQAKLPAGEDHSIAAFFLQLASALHNGAEPASRQAGVILDDILPAYFAVVRK